MKARGKLVSLLMALVCLLPIGMGLLGFGDSASAATPEKIDVTLHKKKMDDFPTGGITNDGEVNPDLDSKYEPLKGVKFQPWDITEDFYRLLEAAGVTGNESKDEYNQKVKQVMESAKKSDFGAKKDAGEAKVTGDNGQVKFTGLDDRDTDGVYRVYWFEEQEVPAEQEYSQLVILALPVVKPNTTTPNKDIHLYPKNKLDNKPEKDLLDDNGNAIKDKTLVSYDVGKEIKYKVTYMIPNQIAEIYKKADGVTDNQTRYSQLVFKDAVSHDGVRFVGIDSINIGNGPDKDVKDILLRANSAYATHAFENYGSEYAATGKKAGFEISMALDDRTGDDAYDSIRTAKWLGKYAGQTMEIIYTVKFTEDTPIDKEIKNDFYVDLQQSGKTDTGETRPEETPPSVVTGGKRFLKHEADTEQTLKGAEFVITNELGNKYLAGDKNNYTWETVVGTDYQNAIKITSGDNGLFEITGLAYGTYKLVETKAPNGYKIGDPVTFIVDQGSYEVEVGLRDKIANVSRGGFLPSTGGIGIAIFLIIGGSLMGFAVSRYRKQQHAA